MNSKNSRSKNPSKKKVETPTTEAESFLLAMRKAQAEELAAKKDTDFSLEQELHDIKVTLLNEEGLSEGGAPVEKQEVLSTPLEEKALLEKTKKSPAQIKSKTASPKKTPKQENKTPTKSTKEKAVVKKDSSKEVTAPKVIRKPTEKTPSIESLLEKKEAPKNEEKQVDFFESIPKQAASEPQENKVVDNLQKLREQIFAQKKLERELMEKEALKAQQKDKSLMNKLNALERLVKNEDAEEVEDVLEIEKQNQRLTQQLEEANQKIKELQEEFEKMQAQSLEKNAIPGEETEKELETNQKIADLEVLVAQQKEDNRVAVEKAKADYDKKTKKLEKELQELKAKKDTEDNQLQAKALEKELKEKEKAFQKEWQAKEKEYQKSVADKEKEIQKLLVEKDKEKERALQDQEKDLLKQLAEKDKALEKATQDKEKDIASGIEKEKALLLKEKAALEKSLEKEKQSLINKNEKALDALKKSTEKKIEQALLKANQKLEKKQTEFNEKLKATKEETKKKQQEAYDAEQVLLVQQHASELASLQKLFDQKQEANRLAFDKEKAEWNQQIKTVKHNLLDSEAKALEQEKFRQDLLAQEQNKQEQAIARLTRQHENQLNELTVKLNNLVVDAQAKENQLNEQLTNKDQEINQLKQTFDTQIKQMQKEMEASNLSNDTKIHSLQDQLVASNRVIDSQKHEIEKLNEIHETLKQAMTDERNNHYEIEQKLFKDLDIRNQEVNQLKADIDKIVKDANANKLDSQISAIANLVNELGNKSKELYQQPTANSVNSMLYNPYFQKEQFQMFKYEYEQELKRQKEEEEEKKNREVEQNNLEVKLSSLEDKIQELAAIFSEKEKSQAMKANQEQIIQTISSDLEKFKQELKADLEQKLATKEQPKEFSHGMQAIVDRYTRDKDLLAFQFNNEVNKLEVDKKFENNPDVLLQLEEKIEFVRKRYRQLALNRDQEFQNEVSLFYGYHPEEAPFAPEAPVLKQEEPVEEPTPMEEELPPVGEAPEEAIEASQDDFQKETLEASQEDFQKEETLVSQPSEEKEEILQAPSIEATKQETPRRDQIDTSHFVGKIDQEYLNKSNNIKRMKKMLEGKKTEISLQYEKDIADNAQLQKECIQKIDVINEKITSLEETHRTKKSFLSPVDRQFENDKTKLYLELESRKEQLHRLQAEDKRKLDTRYQSAMNNIQEQMKALEAEEQELKEEYVLKQQKIQSKLSREEELTTKLQEEQTRIIESQETIKLRKLDTVSSVVESVPEEEPVIEKVDESTPQEQTQDQEERVIQAQEESPVVESKQVELSPKEKELRALYEKYALVEKRLVDDFGSVREYKSNKLEILAYEKEISKQSQLIDQYKEQERQSETEQEARSWDWKGKDVKIKQDNIKVRLQYLKKQQEQLTKDPKVLDYQKLTEKLDMMMVLLKQYAQKRGQA